MTDDEKAHRGLALGHLYRGAGHAQAAGVTREEWIGAALDWWNNATAHDAASEAERWLRGDDAPEAQGDET